MFSAAIARGCHPENRVVCAPQDPCTSIVLRIMHRCFASLNMTVQTGNRGCNDSRLLTPDYFFVRFAILKPSFS